MTVSVAKKRATIRDVARRALVSYQTVSRVINGELSIAPSTRARVERAMVELGFRPNHIARSLVSRKTFTVGLVMGDVASPFFPDVVRGAEDVLSPLGYSLVLSSSRRDQLVEPVRRAAVPMVFLNRDVQGPNAVPVWVDWPRATAEVVAYLAEL